MCLILDKSLNIHAKRISKDNKTSATRKPPMMYRIIKMYINTDPHDKTNTEAPIPSNSYITDHTDE